MSAKQEYGVEHHSRAEALSGQGETGVGRTDARTQQEPVTERVTHGAPPRDAMAEGESGELDPGQGGQPGVGFLGYQGAGELEVGDQGRDLEHQRGQRQERVRRSQHMQGLVGATDLGHDEVLDDETDDQELGQVAYGARQPRPVPAPAGASAAGSEPRSAARCARASPWAEGAKGAAPVREGVLGVGEASASSPKVRPSDSKGTKTGS